MVFKLYTDQVPLTAENFRCLCTGEKGEGRTTGRVLHYKGAGVHLAVLVLWAETYSSTGSTTAVERAVLPDPMNARVSDGRDSYCILI